MLLATNERMYQDFGYTEMYEFSEVPLKKFGLFLQFDKKHPEKVCRYHQEGAPLVGISTITSSYVSDDPDEWKGKFEFNEYGDYFLQKKDLIIGNMEYDQQREFSYISTKHYEQYTRIPTQNYSENQPYAKRSKRNEWIKVNILGKCIVVDDGTCKPGEYCKPYTGKEKEKWGHAIPATKDDSVKFYVLSRLSDNTVFIINRNVL